MGEKAIGRLIAKAGSYVAIAHPDDPLAPARPLPDKLTDRQGIEELVGDKPERPFRQIGHRVVPCRVRYAQRLRLPQLGRGLYEMHLGSLDKSGHGSGCPQDVRHERAAPRAELCKDETVGRTLIEPRFRQRQANQLAKHLADLGRGGEIARRAEGIARGIIAVLGVHQGLGHIIGNGDRSGGRDPGAKHILDRAHVLRLGQSTRTRPIRIIGSERFWPMVRPQSPH